MSMTVLSAISETRAPVSTSRIWTLGGATKVSGEPVGAGEESGPRGGGRGEESSVGGVLVRLYSGFGPAREEGRSAGGPWRCDELRSDQGRPELVYGAPALP